MGGGGSSSSKRKSSKKKRDKTSQKKKSKIKVSKKRSRVYDSVSSYSDDDSFNSEYSSSPILKSDYKRKIRKSKKPRRRDHSVSSYSNDSSKTSDSDSDFKSKKPRRSNIASKGKNKKPKKRYDSSDSDEDAHRSRKRKRSTRDSRKKSSKKKSKKHVSSSSSSDSQSYDERQRSKVMLREKIEVPKGEESEGDHRKREVRSQSRSSFSRDGDHLVSVGYSDEPLAPVSNSRRLKSVITIVNQSHEEEDIWEKDPNKEEIMYDYNDYPSPKSLDSNEEESQKELDNHSHGEEVTKLEKSGTHGDHQVNDAHMNNFEKENETVVSVPVAAVVGDDLESILRQKALENLRKFKGGLQKGPRSSTIDLKLNYENDIKGSSSEKAETIENKHTNKGKPNTQVLNQRSGLTLQRDLSRFTEVKGEDVEPEHGMAKQTVTQPPDEENFTSSNAVLVQGESQSDIIPSAGATNDCNSSIREPTSSSRPISEEHSLEDQQNELKDSSQFEQKTMAVMRGGEMVQVSYKVYIPKRAPALGRRQLRR